MGSPLVVALGTPTLPGVHIQINILNMFALTLRTVNAQVATLTLHPTLKLHQNPTYTTHLKHLKCLTGKTS